VLRLYDHFQEIPSGQVNLVALSVKEFILEKMVRGYLLYLYVHSMFLGDISYN
jgi:hypothetical protein